MNTESTTRMAATKLIENESRRLAVEVAKGYIQANTYELHIFLCYLESKSIRLWICEIEAGVATAMIVGVAMVHYYVYNCTSAYYFLLLFCSNDMISNIIR